MRSFILFVCTLTTSLCAQAYAEEGDWLVRIRGIIVAPTESSSSVTPGFPDGTVSVSNAIMPELDFTYFLTERVGAELILATTPHDISGEGSLSGLEQIAETMALPPTLTLQYHFMPDARVRPYLGVGVNYTIFYDEDVTASLTNAIGSTTIDLDDSVGVAIQLGIDFDVTERVFMNFDIKYIDIATTGTLNTGGMINTVDVDLDPIVAGIGFGMRF